MHANFKFQRHGIAIALFFMVPVVGMATPQTIGLSADTTTTTTTAMDSAKNDMPPSRSPRKTMFERVAEQTTPEIIKDLGRIEDAASVIPVNDNLYVPTQIEYWQYVLSNPKVLRLIEEGETASDELAKALYEKLAQELNDYPSAVNAAKTARSFSGTTIPPADPRYVEEGKYTAPLLEIWRATIMIRSLFYTLANINELDQPAPVVQWLNTPGDRRNGCREFDAWLIYQSMKQSRAGNAPLPGQCAAIFEKYGYAQIPDQPQARWNAPQAMHERMIHRMDVDTKDIPTIKVLGLPRKDAITESDFTILVQAMIDSTRQ